MSPAPIDTQYSVVVPLSQVDDLTAILYLNPELAAYSNVRTVEDALLHFDEFSNLPNVVPTLPSEFDVRVYVAAQSNVSALNRAIRDSAIRDSAGDTVPQATLDRTGEFVGTLMCPATVVSKDEPFVLTLLADLHEGILQAGDRLRLVRSRNGFVLDAEVSNVDYDNNRVTLAASSNPRVRAALALAAEGDGSLFEVLGIMIYDPERQARVGVARELRDAGTLPSGPDAFKDPEKFVYDLYQLFYPGTRGLRASDTYLDYRRRLARGETRRLRGAEDIANLEALPSMGGGGGSNVDSASTLVARDSLSVGPSGFSVFSPSNALVSRGFLRVTATSLEAGLYNNNVSPASDLRVFGGQVALCGSNFAVSSSGTRASALVECMDTLRVGATGSNFFSQFSADGASIGAGALTVTAGPVVSVRDSLHVGVSLGVGTSNPEVPADGDGEGVRLAVGGDIFATGTVTTLSDRSAKVDIRPIRTPLERLQNLSGCTYLMASCPEGRRHTGLVAQDVLDALPEAVYETPGGALSVAYGNMAGLLVEGIKEIVTRLEDVEKRFAMLNPKY